MVAFCLAPLGSRLAPLGARFPRCSPPCFARRLAGYIICAFLSPTLNQRTDAYGGSLEGRSKLLFDLIDGVRARCRPDFQLGVRISPERFGLQLGEQIEIAKRIMATGKVDYLDLSLWDAFKLPEEEEFKSKALAEWFVDIPRNGCRVGVAGKVYDAETCKKILAMGYDFVVPGRAAVIHHDMPNLIKADGEWKMRAWPVPVAEMEKEGVSPKFVSYLRSWFPGLLEPAESA